MKSAIYIGRFQPFHDGHMHVIETALKNGITDVQVLIGSADKPRSIKNPFTYHERREMILDSFAGSEYEFNITCHPLPDEYNESIWIQRVNEIAATTSSTHILGAEKDESSYYIRHFPHLNKDYVGHLQMQLDATDIREFYFRQKLRLAKGAMPSVVVGFLQSFAHTREYKKLVEEFQMIQAYKASWSAAPYAPTFVTVDAVVIQSGHVLMVERGAAPGKGLWALPGGFINQKERIQDAAVRELIEETEIAIPEIQLRRAITESRVFDDPNRSLRGRTITHAFLFRLDDSKPLPAVKGADDAASAFWVPLNALKSEKIFEDHYSIINEMVRRAN